MGNESVGGGPTPEEMGISKMDQILDSSEGESGEDDDLAYVPTLTRRSLNKGGVGVIAAAAAGKLRESADGSHQGLPDALPNVVEDGSEFSPEANVAEANTHSESKEDPLAELHEGMVMDLPDIDETTIHQRYAPGLPADQTSAAENALQIYPNPGGYIQVEYQFDGMEADYFVFYLTEADYMSKPGRGIPVDANGGKVDFSTFPEMQSLFNNGEFQGFMVRAVLVEDGKHLALASSDPKFDNPEAVVTITYEDLSETQPVESINENPSEVQPVESSELVQPATPESDDPLAGDRISEVKPDGQTTGGGDGGGFPYVKAGAGAGGVIATGGIIAGLRRFFKRDKSSNESDMSNSEVASSLASEKKELGDQYNLQRSYVSENVRQDSEK